MHKGAIDEMEQDKDRVLISGLVDPHLLFKLIRKVVLNQSDNQCKLLVVYFAKQECLAQLFINNSNARTQSSNVKDGILQGVQRDNGDVLASSEMRCAHFEACEEEATHDNQVRNETYYDRSITRMECVCSISGGKGRLPIL